MRADAVRTNRNKRKGGIPMKPNELLISVLHNLFAVQPPALAKKKVIKIILQSRGHLVVESAEQVFRKLVRCGIIERSARCRLVINKNEIQRVFDTHCLDPILYRIGF